MKFTLNWLMDYLETDASLEQILNGLLGIGLEVEEVVDRRSDLAPFTLCRVVEAQKHPNADKLRLCKVDTGSGLIQVVCGAPNARGGMQAILALPGAVIPATGSKLEVGKIRGEESQGMMCSERELLLSEEHDGIIEVQTDLPLGTAAASVLGLDDPMIYVKVTANRPDALGVYGIARDLAAKGLGQLKPLVAPKINGTFTSPISVALKFPSGDTSACPHFMGRYFKGLTNGSSPQWMQRRLKAIGLRPISALVDITNYITFSFGRPLHVFDAKRLKGPITARAAHEGEEIDTLDNKRHSLSAGMTVIADTAGPLGIAGIIGGSSSSCSDETTEVFLEAAYFDPRHTASTGRKLGIHSDARYRFERGIDPGFTEMGANIASAMIIDLCGGEASHLVNAGAAPMRARCFTLRKDRVKNLAGVDIPLNEQGDILSKLGFVCEESDEGLSCAVPSWRPDVHGEADVVEEVVRIYGMDRIPLAPLERAHAVAMPVLNPLQLRMLAVRRTLSARGFNEAVTWSFLSEPVATLFGGGQAELKLANPISSELSDMRPSLLANLIAAAGRNVARGAKDFALSEIGQAYAGDRPQDETLRAAGIRQGRMVPKQWQGGARNADAYDAKADLLAALEAAGAAVGSLQIVATAPPWFHPGRSGTLQMGPQTKLGFFGEIHPSILSAMDVSGPLIGFELILSAVPVSKTKTTTRAALQLSDLLAVTRDFAFVVTGEVEAEKLVKAVKSADKALIAEASVFDVFELGEGLKSYAVEVVLQPQTKTLTDEDIDTLSQKIVATVAKAVGAKLRT